MENSFEIFEDGYVEPKQEEKNELIAKLQAGDFTLSFSSLSAFAISPAAFIAYKLQERKTTKAMLLGEVMHFLVLEPDKAKEVEENSNERYFLAPNVNGATKEGKAVWEKIYADFVGEPGENFKMKIDDIIAAVKDATGTVIIPGAIYEEAKFRARRIFANRACRSVLNQIDYTEKKIEFDFSGLKFRGVIDAGGHRIIADLKNMPDATLEKATGSIWARRLHWQAFGYDTAIGGGNLCHILAVDGNGETSVHAFNQRNLDAAERQMKRVCGYFKQAVVESLFDPGIWDMSQDFWLRSDMNTHGINYL